MNEVRVQNLTRHARRDVVSCVLPWAAGQYHGGPLHVNGEQAQSRTLGARWPNGSVRHCKVWFPVQLLGGEDREVRVFNSEPMLSDLATSHGARIPTSGLSGFSWAPSIRAGLARTSLEVFVGSRATPLQHPELIESGPHAMIYRFTGRVPSTPVWYEMHVEIRSGCDHAGMWLSYGTSDPRSDLTTWDLPEIGLRVSGPKVVAWHSDVRVRRYQLEDTDEVLTLDEGGRWGEGQSQALAGCLLFPPAEDGSGIDWSTYSAQLQMPVVAVATTWPASRAYGVFGVVPTPPWDDHDLPAVVVEDYARRPRDNWGEPVHGSRARHETTGEGSGMGHVGCLIEAAGHPAGLFARQLDAQQEMCRPMSYREANGEPISAADHPKCYLWSMAPFRTARDMLGKARELAENDLRRAPKKPHSEPWTPADREHLAWSDMLGYATLTGDVGTMAAIEAMADVALLDSRVDTDNTSINSSGTGRALGRHLRLLCQLYLLTGRDDLRRRIVERLDVAHAAWVGKDIDAEKPWRPLQVRSPHPNALEGAYRWISCWEEAIATACLRGVHLVTGDERAADMALVTATMLRDHGLVDGKTTYVVAWNDGDDPVQDPDKPNVRYMYGVGAYYLGALVAGRGVARERSQDDGKWDSPIVKLWGSTKGRDLLRLTRWGSVR